jgi:hypothetical protein
MIIYTPACKDYPTCIRKCPFLYQTITIIKNSIDRNITHPLVVSTLIVLGLPQPAWPQGATPQYLLFHIFIGSVDTAGVYSQTMPANVILDVAQTIAATIRPAATSSKRILGFDIGPISMDQGAAGAVTTINAAFDIALATDMAVAIHLDDYMFWKQATWPNGRSLLATPGTTEWTNWSGSPAGPLTLSWIPNTNLAPQMCYDSPEIQAFVNYWLLDVIGPAIAVQYDRLVLAGKPELFAGVFAGWESNLSYGYCSLSQLGYSSQNLPSDYETAREAVLQQHISLWAQDLYNSGIPKNLIYTHLATISAAAYAALQATLTPAQIEALPDSTAFRAFWTAFNPYSNSGWSNYNQGVFQDIYNAVGVKTWTQSEGSNVILGNCNDSACPSPYDWESYLAASYNHGANLVDIFGAFQGETGAFTSAQSTQAVAAYQKFLEGETLIESPPTP